MEKTDQRECSTHVLCRVRSGSRPWMEQIERVVLVHRLREVVARGRFYAIRGGCARHRRRTRHRSTPRFPSARSELASSVREQGRGHLPPVQDKSSLGLDATARSSSTRRQTERGIRGMAQGTSGDNARVSWCRIFDAAFVFSSSHYSAIAQLWVSREFHPGAGVRDTKCRLWHFALHRHFRCRRDARWIGAGGSKDTRDRQGSVGLGDAVFKRSGVCAT